MTSSLSGENKLAFQIADMSGKGIPAAIKADVDAFVGEAPQFDDITMLCLEYRGALDEL